MRPLRFPREQENTISISIAFGINILIGNENIISDEHKTTKNNLASGVSYKPSKFEGYVVKNQKLEFDRDLIELSIKSYL